MRRQPIRQSRTTTTSAGWPSSSPTARRPASGPAATVDPSTHPPRLQPSAASPSPTATWAETRPCSSRSGSPVRTTTSDACLLKARARPQPDDLPSADPPAPRPPRHRPVPGLPIAVVSSTTTPLDGCRSLAGHQVDPPIRSGDPRKSCIPRPPSRPEPRAKPPLAGRPLRHAFWPFRTHRMIACRALGALECP